MTEIGGSPLEGIGEVPETSAVGEGGEGKVEKREAERAAGESAGLGLLEMVVDSEAEEGEAEAFTRIARRCRPTLKKPLDDIVQCFAMPGPCDWMEACALGDIL